MCQGCGAPVNRLPFPDRIVRCNMKICQEDGVRMMKKLLTRAAAIDYIMP
jgi:hypothetical protein